MLPATPCTPQLLRHERQLRTPPAHERRSIPEFVMALRQDCVDRVQEALDANPDAIWYPPLGYSVDPPLCVAIELGCNPEVIRLLLDCGADIYSKNLQGHTPLSLLKAQAHLSSDQQRVRDIALMLKMLDAQSWNDAGEQAPATKNEIENAKSAGRIESPATAFTRDNHFCFPDMLPQVPSVETLEECLSEKGKHVGHFVPLATAFRAAWCAKDVYSWFAEMPPQFPPVPDLSKPDLHEKLDGLLLGALIL